MTDEKDIRPHIPNLEDDEELKIVKESDIPEGFVEVFITHFQKLGLRIYRSLTIKRIVYVVLISLSALEGMRLTIPLEKDLPVMMLEFENKNLWLNNVMNNTPTVDTRRYFEFNYPANPSPTEEFFESPRTTIVAPITGSSLSGIYHTQDNIF